MQNTRLNNLFDGALAWLSRWLQNPWRRVSLIIISLLLGNFLATAIATVSGQQAALDIVVAILLTGVTEFISWVVYKSGWGKRQPSRSNGQRALLVELFNAIKLGVIYGLFVEAFKLGS